MPEDLVISSEFPFAKIQAQVGDSTIAYVDEGMGQPVVFLHGNPTSSYLWRNIIPYVTDGYRAIAPDLIGMGDSGKPDISYSFDDHANYIDQFIELLELENVVLVVHDWGSAIGMQYARLNPGNVAALVFMESLVPPAMPAPSYDSLGPEAAAMFQGLRSEGVGENMVLENNFFVEEVLPKFGVIRDLSEAEMNAYRAPYKTPESRLPTLQWPRELPIAGEPAHTVKAVIENGKWLMETEIPKLLFHATPGGLIPPQIAKHLGETLKNIETVSVGEGLHFLQEDHPHHIGMHLARWLKAST